MKTSLLLLKIFRVKVNVARSKVKVRQNVKLAQPLMKMSLYTNMKCLAQAVAEKSRGQDFQGQGHCGKVKGQSATKRDISTTPHEDESVYRI